MQRCSLRLELVRSLLGFDEVGVRIALFEAYSMFIHIMACALPACRQAGLTPKGAFSRSARTALLPPPSLRAVPGEATFPGWVCSNFPTEVPWLFTAHRNVRVKLRADPTDSPLTGPGMIRIENARRSPARIRFSVWLSAGANFASGAEWYVGMGCGDVR